MSKATSARPPGEPGPPPPRSSLRYRAEHMRDYQNGPPPASSFVLSNMIDSFGTIAPDQQSAQPNDSGQRTPLRSARSSFEKYRSRPTRLPESDQREGNVEYVTATFDPDELPTDDDAAEAPTIRIARQPSGISKVTSRTNSIKYRPSREFPPVSYRSPSPSSEIRVSKKSGSASAKGSSRPSMDKRSSRESGQLPMATARTDKGKGRATEASDARAGSSQSQVSSASGPDTPERTSSMRANTGRPMKLLRNKSGDQADTTNSGFVRAKTPTSASRTQKKERLVIAEDPEDSVESRRNLASSKSSKMEPPIFPRRKSSKSPRVSRPASEDDTRKRIPAPVPEATPAVPSVPPGQEEGLGIKSVKLSDNEDNSKAVEQRVTIDPEEDTDVMRRIRELKAAKEQREKDRATDDVTASEDGPLREQTLPLSPSDKLPPETSLAKEQLALAPEFDGLSENVRDKSSKSPRFASSPLVKSSSSATGASPLPPGKVSFSNDGPGSLGRSPIITNIDEQLQLQKSPLGSRAGSRARRTSVGKSPSMHKRRGSGTQSLFSAQGGNESQLSIDSVQVQIDEYLQAPRMHQTVVPPGERRIIAFSEVGDPEGYPVICCVGMGITRHAMTFYDELAASLKLRLITPDRPGVGDSTACSEGYRVPLRWPDDVNTICAHLNIQEFSLLAHSAGAIFALATALRMPNNVRCKVHLLASWIPPSSMSQVGLPADTGPAGNLPRYQRFLKILPTAFLKLSNASSLTSTPSLSKKDAKGLNGTPRKSTERGTRSGRTSNVNGTRMENGMDSPQFTLDDYPPDIGGPDIGPGILSAPRTPRRSSITGSVRSRQAYRPRDPKERQRAYDSNLTAKIWELARLNANPVVDLLICIERSQSIGFRYVDIAKPVVMHHGTKDTRVPVENARWVAQTMQRAEVRELEGEGHSLMASAGVMASVLTEIAQEWEDDEARTDRTGSTEHVPSHSQRK